MSKSIRSEQDRRIAELEALVSGQATEIVRLSEKLDECESNALKLALVVEKLKPKEKE